METVSMSYEELDRVRKAFTDLRIIQFEDVDTDALDQQPGLI
jgi:hypothetical protein